LLLIIKAEENLHFKIVSKISSVIDKEQC